MIACVHLYFTEEVNETAKDVNVMGKDSDVAVTEKEQRLESRENRLGSSTHCLLGKFSYVFCHLQIFFKNQLFKKIFQEYHQSVKQFGSRSGPTFCWA